MFVIVDYLVYYLIVYFFFFKQKTAYEMRISDWSSDVCSSDLVPTVRSCAAAILVLIALALGRDALSMRMVAVAGFFVLLLWPESLMGPSFQMSFAAVLAIVTLHTRSEEHTSELQSLMRISYAVFCLKKKKPQYVTRMRRYRT